MGGTRALAAAAALAAGLIAPPGATARTPDGALGGGPIARQSVSAADLVKTRSRFFGAENVDQTTGAVRRDRAILSWFGVSNFAFAIRGHVLLLDAWVPRGTHSRYVPTTPEELAQLKPELIVIGHTHFDHAADAVPIALASGATLVGTAEHCDALTKRSPALPPRCISAIPPGAGPGGKAELDLVRGVKLTAVKNLHSAATNVAGDGSFHVPVTPPPSTTTLEHPPTSEDLVHILGRLPDDEGGSVLYRFETGDLSLVWNDSAGPLSDRAAPLLSMLRELRPVDVHVGAIQGFNQATNGMRDPVDYIEALAPETFVPMHHDDWAVGITTKGEHYREPFYNELNNEIPAADRPQVRFITDPDDYVRPEALSFPVKLDPPKLTRSCDARGRLRVSVKGDSADVRRADFTLPGVKKRRDRVAPFARSFPAGALKAARGKRLRAKLRGFDGARVLLKRGLPRCKRTR